jgi:hypothetical protein
MKVEGLLSLAARLATYSLCWPPVKKFDSHEGARERGRERRRGVGA